MHTCVAASGSFRSTRFFISRLCFLLAGSFVFLTAVSQKWATSVSAAEPQTSFRHPTAAQSAKAPPEPQEFQGPWGCLVVEERLLEMPASHVQRTLSRFNPDTTVLWEFPNTLEEVRNIFRMAGLEERKILQLTSKPSLEFEDRPVRIRPPETILLSLTPEQRQKLYPSIGFEHPGNFFKHPLDLMPGGIDRMNRSASKIPAHLIEQMRLLEYRADDGRLAFSDIVYTLLKAATKEEREALIHFISREPIQDAWLDLKKSAQQRPQVLAYWGANGKNQRAADFLRAAFDNPEIDRVDVCMLLPLNPGRMVNTFPSPEDGLGTSYPDCVATAMSFFEEDIPSRFIDIWEPGMLSGYEPAVPAPKLGDVYFVIDGNGYCVHAFNVIAGPLVFTKNGISRDRAWTLQMFDDVLKSYPVTPPTSLECYRRRDDATYGNTR